MFWPNWPSSGVEAAVVKDSAAYGNAGFFPPLGGIWPVRLKHVVSTTLHLDGIKLRFTVKNQPTALKTIFG
jgi:hypothetical protein